VHASLITRVRSARGTDSHSRYTPPSLADAQGVFIDHGTGIIIGPRAVVGQNVSVLHMVTIEGARRRHPVVGERVCADQQSVARAVDNMCLNVRHAGDGVRVGARATVLGANVGSGSLVGACSLVLDDLPESCVAVGVPARVIGGRAEGPEAGSSEPDDAYLEFEI
jgi:serine O-acetyltransferase